MNVDNIKVYKDFGQRNATTLGRILPCSIICSIIVETFCRSLNGFFAFGG